MKSGMLFGKHKGKTVLEVLNEDPRYILWLKNANVCKVDTDVSIAATNSSISPDTESIHSDWGLRD